MVICLKWLIIVRGDVFGDLFMFGCMCIWIKCGDVWCVLRLLVLLVMIFLLVCLSIWWILYDDCVDLGCCVYWCGWVFC